MLAADGDAHLALLAADTLHVAQRAAGNDEAAFLQLPILDILTALGEAVSVHGNHGQALVLHVEERAGIDGAHVGRGDGEDGLIDHAAQGVLRQADRIQAVHAGHFRVIGGGHAHEVIVAAAAFDVDVIVIVGAHGDDAVRQAADHLAEEARADDHGARLLHVRLDCGINAFL